MISIFRENVRRSEFNIVNVLRSWSNFFCLSFFISAVKTLWFHINFRSIEIFSRAVVLKGSMCVGRRSSFATISGNRCVNEGLPAAIRTATEPIAHARTIVRCGEKPSAKPRAEIRFHYAIVSWEIFNFSAVRLIDGYNVNISATREYVIARVPFARGLELYAFVIVTANSADGDFPFRLRAVGANVSGWMPCENRQESLPLKI